MKTEITRQKLLEQRRDLPIASAEQKLVEAVQANPTLIVIGETGSGKTTQLPQFLTAAGFESMAVTQPRRVAAISVAHRVAQEVGCGLGQEVGYTVRFDDVSTARTRIKYMTDGMLLREALLDPLLEKYSLVIVDEAHERTVSTDVLFGVLKQVQARRAKAQGSGLSALKLVIMSATLDAVQFQEYFQAPVVYVQGRQYPVQVFYTEEPEADYLDAAVTTVLQVHLEEAPGAILVFLTGQEEIETAERLILERAKSLPAGKPSLAVMPIYAALSSEQQLRVFQPPPEGSRKVVLATNIAETSLTIPGVRYVVDPGLVKARAFSARLALEALAVVPVSKAQARQRSGRAGREGPGKCFRLFTEGTFQGLEDCTVPEIRRCNPAGTLLQLKAMGVEDVLAFDFMDRPPRPALVKALEQLYALGALTRRGQLSPEGRQMARFPLDPVFAKALLVSGKFQCGDDVAALTALLSVEAVFLTPRDKQKEARAAKLRFVSPFGDHLTLLRLFRAFLEASKKGAKAALPWCAQNFVSFRSLSRALDVYRQVRGQCEGLGMSVASCGEDWEALRRCLASSFFLNAAKRQPDNTYRALANGQTVSIHPSSVLVGKKAECVVYNEMVRTSRQYIRDVTVIEPQWLVEFAPHFYARKE